MAMPYWQISRKAGGDLNEQVGARALAQMDFGKHCRHQPRF
jgi:hypothetical protein